MLDWPGDKKCDEGNKLLISASEWEAEYENCMWKRWSPSFFKHAPLKKSK